MAAAVPFAERRRDRKNPPARYAIASKQTVSSVAVGDADSLRPAIMKAVDEIGYRGWAITEQSGGDTPEGLRDLASRLEKILML